jgi:hypothetical protein
MKLHSKGVGIISLSDIIDYQIKISSVRYEFSEKCWPVESLKPLTNIISYCQWSRLPKIFTLLLDIVIYKVDAWESFNQVAKVKSQNNPHVLTKLIWGEGSWDAFTVIQCYMWVHVTGYFKSQTQIIHCVSVYWRLSTENSGLAVCKGSGKGKRMWAERGSSLCCLHCCSCLHLSFYCCCFRCSKTLYLLPCTELGCVELTRGRLASEECEGVSGGVSGEQTSSQATVLQLLLRKLSDDGVVLTHLYSSWIGFLYTVLGWVRVLQQVLPIGLVWELGGTLSVLGVLLLLDWWPQTSLWGAVWDSSYVIAIGVQEHGKMPTFPEGAMGFPTCAQPGTILTFTSHHPTIHYSWIIKMKIQKFIRFY